MAASLPKKPKNPVPEPATTKLNLIALKKAPETLPSPPAPVEPEAPVEPTVSVEPPAPVESPASVEPKKPLKPILPIKRSSVPVPPTEEDSSLPSNSNAIFQAIGVIVGDVILADKKAHVTIADKQYPLYYASSHKKAFEALRMQIKTTGQTKQRLIVYPKVMHFPKREQPYLIGFQLVGFDAKNVKEETENCGGSSIDQELIDGEFKLSGLWQFIPVCQTPCITIQKNFSDERLTYIKEATVEQKVNFMKASHIPVMWRDAPVRPFRFNPKLDKERQGQASFVEIKAKFLPDRDVFEFCELRSRPTQTPPKFLKVGSKDKAQALKDKNQRQRDGKH